MNKMSIILRIIVEHVKKEEKTALENLSRCKDQYWLGRYSQSKEILKYLNKLNKF